MLSKHPQFMHGKKFVQASLKSDFQNAIAGQSALFRCLLMIFVTCLSVLCGAFAGITGGFISLYAIFPQATEQRLFILGATLVVLTSILEGLQQGFLQGFRSAVVASLIVVTSSTILLGKFDNAVIVATALFSLLLGSTALLSLLTGSLSIALLLILLDRPEKATKIYTVLTIFAAFVLANLLIFSLKSRASFPNELSLTALSVCAGLLFGSSAIAVSSFMTTSTAPKRFEFFRKWAIGIGCWNGTSFYDLDLSEVDFRNAKLANSDLRARKLYRTCFQDTVGLERARVDNQYFDLEHPKVQQLLTHGSSRDRDFRGFNLQGAYLQNADLRSFDFTDTNLTGADLKGADLRGSTLIRTQLAGSDFQGVDLRKNVLIDANLTEASLRTADLRESILVRAQVARADFSGADLTGICIEDWSVSSKTNFTNVRCDYIYRRYQDEQPTDRYPVDRNFEAREFAALFQQSENELELIFKGEFDYTALSLTFDKLQTDKPELNLKLQGIEQRKDLWVVKVTSDDPANVEARIKEIQDAVYQGYEVTATRLENNPLIRRIISDVANIRKTQQETVEEVKQLAQRIGSNFYFLGGTITNVTGAGEINYTEASNQVRSLVSSSGHKTQAASLLLSQLKSSNVATTTNEQTELIEFVILEEAQRDPQFKQVLLQQKQQILAALPESAIATALRGAIAQLTEN